MASQEGSTPAFRPIRIMQAQLEELQRIHGAGGFYAVDEAEYIEAVAEALTMCGTSVQARILRKSSELQYDPEVKARMAREADTQSAQLYYDEDRWRTS